MDAIVTSTRELTIYGGAKLLLTMAIIARNKETDKYLIHWRLYIQTDSTTYLTSNREQEWKVQIGGRAYNQYETVIFPLNIDTSGKFVVNTDINDEVTISQGVFEYNDTYFKVSFSLTVDNVIAVNVNAETGTTLSGKKYLENVYQNLMFSRYDSDKAARPTIFENFTDEDNPILTYIAKRNSGFNGVSGAISFDGYNEDIKRTLNNETTGNTLTYTFNLTDEERTALRQNMYNVVNKPVYIFVTSGVVTSQTFYRYCIKRSVSIINGNPVLTPYIEDTNATTVALTGDKSVIVRFHSNAYVNSNVEWQKEALEQSNLITVGAKNVNDSEGVINTVESNTFIFSATDSRNLNTIREIKPPYIDYIKLSCYIEHGVVGADTGTLDFCIKGNYYIGSFGAVSNNLGLVYRIKTKDGSWGNWITVNSAEYSENTYSAKVSLTGLDYQETYQIQSAATDKLNYIESVVYTITTVPIFDWGENDFRFNVPVDFADAVNINGEFNLNGNTLADYVIESGTESMGSNGVWKWRKWHSGKAEAWGKRNYGNMGFSTAFGSFYRSETFTQSLPSVFNQEPDTIEINVIKSNGASWILRGIDTSSSASSTGGFALCKNTNTALSAVYLGFYAIGTWK